MKLCRSCAAYLAGPEEFIDPDTTPPQREAMPAILAPERCACCGLPLSREDSSAGGMPPQEQLPLEDLATIQQPIPDLQEGSLGRGVNYGFVVGALIALSLALGALFAGKGFDSFIFLIAGVPSLGLFGALGLGLLHHALLYLIKRPGISQRVLDRRHAFLGKTETRSPRPSTEDSFQTRSELQASDPHIQEEVARERSPIQPPPVQQGP
jgi:hypothetical protein